MKNQLKKLNLTLICIAIFLTFMFVGCKSSAFASSQSAVQAASSHSKLVPKTSEPSAIPEKNIYDVTHVPKTGFKYGIFKFLMSMLGVLISAGAIFIGLKLYKSLISKGNAKFDNVDYDKTLESPKDFKEAINIFLEKTDK